MLYEERDHVRSSITGDRLPAVQLEGVGKVYKLYHRRQDRFLEAIDIFNRNKTKYARRFYALKDINLEIRQGETIGIVGSNGSGKSTLLGIIAGVIQPSFGKVVTRGRISSLLELGAGFNSELTGIENIYFHGTTTGLRREEMDEKRDEIIQFADIGEYIDQPVKTYSSGMFVRLAFAVSICVKPDILIVDEALSVGDMRFQAKCMTAIERIRKSGVTVLFVAHDLGAIKSFCQRAIYLEKGSIKNKGTATDVVEHYLRDMKTASSEEIGRFLRSSNSFTNEEKIDTPNIANPETVTCAFKSSEVFERMVAAHRFGTGGLRIRYVEMTDEQDDPVSEIPFDSYVNIKIHIESECDTRIVAHTLIKNANKIPISQLSFRFTGHGSMDIKKGDRRILVFKAKLPLGEGVYSLEVVAGRPVALNSPIEIMDGVQDAYTFRIFSIPGKAKIWTAVYIPHTLEIHNPDTPGHMADALMLSSQNESNQ
jgi:lipopolysaccharide transport system ATP-binding protein